MVSAGSLEHFLFQLLNLDQASLSTTDTTTANVVSEPSLSPLYEEKQESPERLEALPKITQVTSQARQIRDLYSEAIPSP